jgi:hypothetical protein
VRVSSWSWQCFTSVEIQRCGGNEHNYAMQRTGIDKVLGRGRTPTALIQACHARVPMRWRAVADGGRYIALKQCPQSWLDGRFPISLSCVAAIAAIRFENENTYRQTSGLARRRN